MSDKIEEKIHSIREGIADMKWPQTAILCGLTGSGKNELLKWIIIHYMRLGTWHNIFVLCPTIQTQKEAYDYIPNHLVLPCETETLEKIITFQKTNNQMKTLVIIDDFAGSVDTKSKEFTMVATRGRHSGLSMIMLAQRLTTLIGPTVREQAATLFITQTNGTTYDTLSKLVRPLPNSVDVRKYLEEICIKKGRCARLNLHVSEDGYASPACVAFEYPMLRKRYLIDRRPIPPS